MTEVSTNEIRVVSDMKDCENKIIQLENKFMIGDIEIYAQDDIFFYGKINQYEYSIDKTTTEIYIKNVDTDEWQPLNNQQEQVVDENMMALFVENNNLKMQLMIINGENMRLQNEVIMPLQNSLMQANYTIQTLNNTKGHQMSQGYVSKIQKKNVEMSQYIVELKNEIVNLKMENEKKDNLVERLNKTSKPIKNEEIEKLKTKINYLEQTIESKSVDNKRLTEEIERYVLELKNKSEEIQSKSLEINKKNERITELEETLIRIQKENEEIQLKMKNYEKVKTQNTALRTSNEDKESMIQSLQSRLSNQDREMNKMKSSIPQQVSKQVENEVSERMTEINKELNRLRTNMTQKEGELKAQQNENKKLNKKSKQQEEDMILINTELSSVKSELSNIENKYSGKLIERENHIKELIIDIEKYRTLYKNATSVELVKRTKALKDTEANYLVMIREMDLQRSRLQYECQVMKEKYEQSEQRYNDIYEKWRESKRRGRENGERNIKPVDLSVEDESEVEVKSECDNEETPFSF